MVQRVPDLISSANMPNRLCAKANGRMVYSVPLIIFLDDVSGNISKQWNKHHVVYLSNALLPRQMLEKQFCVRFYSTSPHASPIEFMHALRDNIAYVIYSPRQMFKLMLQEVRYSRAAWMLMIAKRTRKYCSYLTGCSLAATILCKLSNVVMPVSTQIISVGYAKLEARRSTKHRKRAIQTYSE